MFGKIFGSGKKKSEETANATLQSLRTTIDNYIGYENVKNRKQTDQGIRKYWYDLVLQILDNYSKVQNELMKGQLLSTWPASNAIINNLKELRTLLSSDVYRHSTFFETPDVSDSLDIEVIYVLESETILEMRDILGEIEKVKKKLDEMELLDIEKDVFRIKDMVDEVNTTISDRAELIASFELVGI